MLRMIRLHLYENNPSAIRPSAMIQILQRGCAMTVTVIIVS